MFDKHNLLLSKTLTLQWSKVQVLLERLHHASSVRPQSAAEAFRTKTIADGVVKVEFGPIVFSLPEEADRSEASLFVVATGWLCLRSDGSNWITQDFGTRVGYFRRKGNDLMHVYGAHYDLAKDQLGHPVFHGQLKPFVDGAESINALFHSSYSLKNDGVNGLLRSVRLPTAQMDVLSLIVQLSADHLLSKDSGAEQRKAFNELLNEGRAFRGAASLFARLISEEARVCYRAQHWYPSVS